MEKETAGVLAPDSDIGLFSFIKVLPRASFKTSQESLFSAGAFPKRAASSKFEKTYLSNERLSNLAEDGAGLNSKQTLGRFDQNENPRKGFDQKSLLEKGSRKEGN